MGHVLYLFLKIGKILSIQQPLQSMNVFEINVINVQYSLPGIEEVAFFSSFTQNIFMRRQIGPDQSILKSQRKFSINYQSC